MGHVGSSRHDRLYRNTVTCIRCVLAATRNSKPANSAHATLQIMLILSQHEVESVSLLCICIACPMPAICTVSYSDTFRRLHFARRFLNQNCTFLLSSRGNFCLAHEIVGTLNTSTRNRMIVHNPLTCTASDSDPPCTSISSCATDACSSRTTAPASAPPSPDR